MLNRTHKKVTTLERLPVKPRYETLSSALKHACVTKVCHNQQLFLSSRYKWRNKHYKIDEKHIDGNYTHIYVFMYTKIIEDDVSKKPKKIIWFVVQRIYTYNKINLKCI